MLVLEPIFEADLLPEQYAYRAGRGAQAAVTAVHRLLSTGHQQVVDADLSGYFDSIPHAELMKSVARRIVDRQVLHLIKQWLEAPVEEDEGHGHRKRTTHNRDTGRGTPQGAPISPLLSNLYMRRFLLGWQQKGYHHRWSAHIVNYADDFVICCRGQAEEALTAMRAMMATLKLTVNEEKTHVCRLPQERFDFLGYTFGLSGVNYLGRSATIILAGWPRCSLGAESPVFWCGRGCPWWGRRWGSCRGFADTRGGDSDPPAPAHPEGVSGWASPLWSRETGAVVVTDAGIVVVVGVMAVGVRTTTWPRASLRR